jgi:hypothetical protein
MNNTENDIRLKQAVKGIRLESPGPEFASKVMGAILAEPEKKPAFVTEPLLGKRFWILLSAFVLLAVILLVFSAPEKGTGVFQQFFSKMPAPDWSSLRDVFSAAFGQKGSLTWTVMLIMLGGSGLILADKLFEKRKSFSLS